MDKPRIRRLPPKKVSLKELIDAGILKPGKLTAPYKGTNLEAELLSSGLVKFQDREPESPSGAAVAAKQSVMGEKKTADGWAFWHYENAKGKLVPLKSAAKEYLKHKVK